MKQKIPFNFFEPAEAREIFDPETKEIGEFLGITQTNSKERKQNYTTDWIKILDKTLIKKL